MNALCLAPQGAAVLRMVSDFLSEPVFVQGLSVCGYGHWQIDSLFESYSR